MPLGGCSTVHTVLSDFKVSLCSWLLDFSLDQRHCRFSPPTSCLLIGLTWCRESWCFRFLFNRFVSSTCMGVIARTEHASRRGEYTHIGSDVLTDLQLTLCSASVKIFLKLQVQWCTRVLLSIYIHMRGIYNLNSQIHSFIENCQQLEVLW